MVLSNMKRGGNIMKTSLIMSLLVIVLISGSAIAAIDYDGLNIPTAFGGLLHYTLT